MRAASSFQCSCLSNEWGSRFYLRRGPCLQGNMTFVSRRPVFSLYFCNQLNSTLAKIDDYFPRFNSTWTTSSEHQGGLDCVFRHSRWSSLVASKEFSSILIMTKNQTRSSSRYLRRLPVQSRELAARRRNLKYFKIHPSQPRSFENFGGGSVGCLKITEDKSSDSRVHILDVRLIKIIDVIPRRRAWNSRLNIITMPRRRARNSRLNIIAKPRRRARSPRLSRAWSLHPITLQWLNV